MAEENKNEKDLELHLKHLLDEAIQQLQNGDLTEGSLKSISAVLRNFSNGSIEKLAQIFEGVDKEYRNQLFDKLIEAEKSVSPTNERYSSGELKATINKLTNKASKASQVTDAFQKLNTFLAQGASLDATALNTIKNRYQTDETYKNAIDKAVEKLTSEKNTTNLPCSTFVDLYKTTLGGEKEVTATPSAYEQNVLATQMRQRLENVRSSLQEQELQSVAPSVEQDILSPEEQQELTTKMTNFIATLDQRLTGQALIDAMRESEDFDFTDEELAFLESRLPQNSSDDKEQDNYQNESSDDIELDLNDSLGFESPEGNEDEPLNNDNQDEYENTDDQNFDEVDTSSYIEDILNSQTEQDYINSLPATISEKDIERAMSFTQSYRDYQWKMTTDETTGELVRAVDENGYWQPLLDEDGNQIYETRENFSKKDCAEALINPDDMLIAYNYYATKFKNSKTEEEKADADQKLANLEAVIDYNLRNNLDEQAITPDNAYAYALLAQKIEDYYDVDFANQKIANAMHKYDAEHFGNLEDKQLSENYGAVYDALKNPSEEEKAKWFEEYTFTKDNDKPLNNKDTQKTQELVISLARKMVAEELVTTGLSGGEDLNQLMQEKINIILAPQPTEEILNAAELLVQQELPYLDPNSKEYKAALSQKTSKILAGDETTLTAAASAMAKEEEKTSQEDIAEKQEKLQQELKKSKTFNETAMGARSAAYMVELEQFQRRINQKSEFKNGSLYRRTTPLLKQLDDRLTKKYKEKYTEPKKFIQTYGKIAVNSAKTAGKFAVASLIPGAVPCLIARNTYKQLKQVKNELKNPMYSKKQKALMIATAATVTALTAASFVPGVGGVSGIVAKTAASTTLMALPNMFKKSIYKTQKKNLDAHRKNLGPDGNPTNEAIEAHKAKVADLESKIDEAKEQAENGGMSNIFGKNKRKLKKLQDELNTLKADKPKTLAEIIAEEKAIEIKQKNNSKEMKMKIASVAIGMLVGQSVNAATHSQDHIIDGAKGLFSGDGNDGHTDQGSVEQHTGNQNPGQEHSSAEAQQTGAQNSEQGSPETQAATQQTATEQASPEAQVATQQTATEQGSPETQVATQQTATEQGSPEAQVATQQTATEQGSPETQSTTQQTAAEQESPEDQATSGLSDEIKAENLAAAKEAGSGHIGKSDYDSITRNLNMEASKLGMSQDDIAATAKAMGEIYGTNSYEAVHAALAEPNYLAQAMGLEGNFTSASMLEYLQQHPECANNEGLHNYIEEHFDAQDRFHSSNYTVHTQTTVHHSSTPHTPVHHETPTNNPPAETYGRAPQPQVEVQPEVRPEYVATTPPAGTYIRGNILNNNGHIYTYDPHFSAGAHSYAGQPELLGVYRDSQNPDMYVVATNHNGVIKTESHSSYSLEQMQPTETRRGSGIYDNNSPRGNYYGGYYGSGVHYSGTGGITYEPTMVDKTAEVVTTVHMGLDGISHAADVAHQVIGVIDHIKHR